MNYLDLNKNEISNIEAAITNGDSFYGFIPEKGLKFIIREYPKLCDIGRNND